MSDETLRSLERREAEAPDDVAAVEAADRARARAGQPTRRVQAFAQLAAALAKGPEARLLQLRRDTNAAVERVMYAGVRARARPGRAHPEEQAVAVPLVALLAQDVPSLTEPEAERIANAILYGGTEIQRGGDIAQRIAAEAVRLARLALIDGREPGPGAQAFSDSARVAFQALARMVGPPLAARLTDRRGELVAGCADCGGPLRPAWPPSDIDRFPPLECPACRSRVFRALLDGMPRRSPAQEHRESPDRHRDLRP
jgi:hypothetical protein